MKICIDAGHNFSGADTGAVGIGGIREQDITFNIAEILKTELISKGHQVIMTRNSKTDNLGKDVASSLAARVKISNDADCDFFISLHCNSASPAANGTEVLIPAAGGLAQSYGELVQKSVTDRLGTFDRGVRVDTEYLNKRLYVLHNTICPAILVELAFLTNSSDAEKLNNNAEEFASAIALAFSSISGQTRFSDIDDHFAQLHIEKLEAYGIINGFMDGTFRPDEPITRGQAAVMISNALSVLGK